MSEILFTPAAVLDLLTSIEELSDLEVTMTETSDGRIQLTVGESSYDIKPDNATDVEVSEDVIDTVEDANMSTYESMQDSDDFNVYQGEDIESGLLKEIAKSLLLGGMIRLSNKLLK